LHGDLHASQSKPSYLKGTDCYIACSCISYLHYSVPAAPLSKSSAATPITGSINQRYVLLQYTAKYWATHFADSFRDFETPESELASPDTSWEVLSDLVNAFVADKELERITMWIEAAWLSSFPSVPDPRLYAKSFLKSSPSTYTAAAPLTRAIESVYELSKDINILNREWKHVLKAEPYEIWEPSIPSFTKSKFWVDTTDSRLIRLAPFRRPAKYMTLQSQISDSGLEIGVIRLEIPR